MWIKICGITSLEDAELATIAGADALGFVFAESPRRVTPQAVRRITESLPQSIEKIGVFVDAALEEVERICADAGLTGVQLHDSRRTENPEDIGAAIGASTRVLHVVRYSENAAQFASELRAFHRNSENECEPEAILIDSCVAGRQGGTGIAFDWTAARETFAREAPHLRLIAAGGLRPENIRHAIQTLQPWGVDVSSGVEASPGKKDPQRVANFIKVAREAAAELCRPAQQEKVKYSSGSGG